MGRRRDQPEKKRAARAEPIHPTACYRRDELPALLRVGRDLVHAAVQSGELKHAVIGLRQVILGKWILEFVEARMSPGQTEEAPDSDRG